MDSNCFTLSMPWRGSSKIWSSGIANSTLPFSKVSLFPYPTSNVFLRNHLENAELCIPPGSPAKHRSRYLLARSAIKRHLTFHLPSALPGVLVNTFPSLQSEEAKEYLHVSPIHFVMAHDGANKKIETTTTDSDKCAKILLRSMIWYFNTHKLNVALINQIEFRDSKVFTMIVESFTPRAKQKLAMASKFVVETQEYRKRLAEIQGRDSRDDYTIEDVDVERLVEIFAADDLGESSFLAAYTLSLMLKEGNCDIFLASAFILHNIITKHILLSRRRLPLISFDLESEGIIDKFLGSFSDISRNILEDPKWSEAMESQEADCDIMDLVDGRLFRAVIQGMCDKSLSEGIPEAAKEDWRAFHQIVKQLSGQDLSVDGSFESEFNTTATKDDYETKSEALSVLPFSSPVFDEHLKCIYVTADTSISYGMGAMKLYRETTHWHNHRKPLTVKAPNAQVVSKWRYVTTIYNRQYFVTRAD